VHEYASELNSTPKGQPTLRSCQE